MKNISLILIASVVFFSCKKNDTTNVDTNTETIQEVEVQNGRMVFKDLAAFESKVTEFDKKGLQAAIDFKAQFPAFKNLGEALENSSDDNDLRKFDFPHYLLSILNESGEFQVEDTIVAYMNGYKYYIPGNDETTLRKIRTDNSFAQNYHLRAQAGVMPVNVQDNSDSGVVLPTTNIGLSSSVLATHQLQFWAQAPAAGWRKYVHEIQSFYDNWVSMGGCNGYRWRSRLYLRMKLEWKGSHWQPAGETRNINYSVGGAVNLMSGGINGTALESYIINQTGNVTQNFNQVLLLGAFDNSTRCPQGLTLNVGIIGTLYQHIVGDVQANEWYNTGTQNSPLW